MTVIQPHQFPDQPVAHFVAAYQHKHIENQFPHIVPHDGGIAFQKGDADAAGDHPLGHLEERRH